MKKLCCLFLILTIFLFACTSRTATLVPTEKAVIPSPTLHLPVSELPPTLAPTTMPTPRPTLEPAQADKAIRSLLQDSVDCTAPCFWGIRPGHTPLFEARQILSHLDLLLQQTLAQNGKEYFATIVDLKNGPSLDVILTTQDGIVQNLRVKMMPEQKKAGVSREWLAYSPETLIARYGSPSKVDFFIGRGAPRPVYAMNLRFDQMDLIAQYSGYDIQYGDFDVGTGKVKAFRICPLNDQQDFVGLWLGEKLEHPPAEVVSLEEATSLTMEQFAQLMTGDPEMACVNLRADAFP